MMKNLKITRSILWQFVSILIVLLGTLIAVLNAVAETDIRGGALFCLLGAMLFMWTNK